MPNKTAGGRPATGPFLLCGQKKWAKEKAAPVCRPSGSLDQPQASGAAQLDLARCTPRTLLRDSNSARPNLRPLVADRDGAQGKKSENQNL